MIFSELSSYFERIESTSARLEITQILAELFLNLSPEEIEKTAYLLQGRVVPLYRKLEFGMAEKSVIKSILQAVQTDKKTFDNHYQHSGDIGLTAESLKKHIPSMEESDKSISDVYATLRHIAEAHGPGSQDQKNNFLAALIRELDPLSVRYVVRIPPGVLRLGFSDMTILDAYSWMLTGDKKLRKRIEKAYHVRPDLGLIGRILKEKGIGGMDEIQPKVGTPIIMMRAERMSSGQEIVDKLGQCAVEPKYDGFRLQIHVNKKTDEVTLFTRGLDEVSAMYPDIIEGVTNEVTAESVIIEGEAIGYDPQTGSFLPFQETVQRKRKYGVEEKAKEIPLKFFAFELLYLNGESQIFTPFRQRRELLESIIAPDTNQEQRTVVVANDELFDDPKKIEIAFDEAITKGLEGIIAKKLDGIYQAGARGSNWIKFKRSYSSQIDDTIDCLVMGYDYGRGKRAEFGIGAFLAGIFDATQDRFLTVAKIGTGLTDEEWRELKKRCDELVSSSQPARYDVDKMVEADVWVDPSIVVEIKADEISRSPVHTAGRVMKATKSGNAQEVDIAGYALRFPRLEHFRDDKRPEEVTTLEEMHGLFQKQQGK
jgi:DNA ligase-1